MQNGNGYHANGHAPEEHRGEGAVYSHKQIRMDCRAVLRKWLLRAKDSRGLEKALARLEAVVDNKGASDFTATMAARALAEGEQQILTLALRAAEMEDKIGRLDSGESTENVQHSYDVRMPEARSRLED